MTAIRATTAIDPGRIRELTERESKRLEEATQGSKRMYERAHEVMPLGVPSSYHARDPWPIYIERGEGARVWDVDGTERWDFHNGFGSMVMGHAHPAIVKAVSERARLGTHFAAPTEDGIVVAEELARRFGLPKWRFTNSGSEATMDAIRIARGLKEPGHDPQDLRLVPRASRRGDGLRRRHHRLARGRPGRHPVGPIRRRHPATGRGPHRRGSVQRRRGPRAQGRQARGRRPPAGLPDHGGGDDEPRGRPPGARLPRSRARDHEAPRRRPDLRRGEDGPRDRGGRRNRALRRPAGHGHARQDSRRGPPVRGDRRHRRGDGNRRETRPYSRSARSTATP